MVRKINQCTNSKKIINKKDEFYINVHTLIKKITLKIKKIISLIFHFIIITF